MHDLRWSHPSERSSHLCFGHQLIMDQQSTSLIICLGPQISRFNDYGEQFIYNEFTVWTWCFILLIKCYYILKSKRYIVINLLRTSCYYDYQSLFIYTYAYYFTKKKYCEIILDFYFSWALWFSMLKEFIVFVKHVVFIVFVSFFVSYSLF